VVVRQDAARWRRIACTVPGRSVALRSNIEAVLGKGGTGVVYVARDSRLNQRVAIKLLQPDHRL
jgi:serine/threonine protein kinase